MSQSFVFPGPEPELHVRSRNVLLFFKGEAQGYGICGTTRFFFFINDVQGCGTYGLSLRSMLS